MGSPTSKVQNEGKFVHHTLADGDFKHFMKMHEPVTAARTLLTAENATVEIDRVLSTLLKERKPVYINLPVDVAAAKADVRTNAARNRTIFIRTLLLIKVKKHFK